MGKMFICINETVSVDSKREYKAQFTKLKTLITESTINIENKKKDIIVQNNYINYVVTSNNDYTVYIKTNDRRYPVYKCSNKYKSNKVYFNKLKSCFNTETENAFYTFLRSKKIEEFLIDLDNISMTQAKQVILDNDKSKVILFTEKMFIEGIESISISYIHNISKYTNPFIFIEDLYSLYVDWNKTSNNGKCMNKQNFSKKIREFKGIIDVDRQTINRKKVRGVFIFDILTNSTFVYEISGKGLITKSLVSLQLLIKILLNI